MLLQEQWIIGVLSMHVVTLLLIIVLRKHSSFLGVVFFAAGKQYVVHIHCTGACMLLAAFMFSARHSHVCSRCMLHKVSATSGIRVHVLTWRHAAMLHAVAVGFGHALTVFPCIGTCHAYTVHLPLHTGAVLLVAFRSRGADAASCACRCCCVLWGNS